MIPKEILDEILDRKIAGMFLGVLAEVETYNKSTARAKVTPLINVKIKNESLRLPPVELPVARHYGNGFLIIPDYKRGDIVEVKGNLTSVENCIKGEVETISLGDSYNLANCSIIGSQEKRPGILNPTVNKDGLTIAHKNGTYINVQDGKVEIKTGGSTVTIDGSSVEIDTVNVTIIGSSSIKLDGEVEITKKLTCKDEISAAKDITSDTEVIAGASNVKLTQHKHTTVLGPTIPPVIPS